jgi:hypothetical protein
LRRYSKDWILEQWDDGYYITALAGSTTGSALVIMSKVGTTTRPYPLYVKRLGVSVCKSRIPGLAGRADRPFPGP